MIWFDAVPGKIPAAGTIAFPSTWKVTLTLCFIYIISPVNFFGVKLCYRLSETAVSR